MVKQSIAYGYTNSKKQPGVEPDCFFEKFKYNSYFFLFACFFMHT